MTGFRPPPERHWRSYGTDPLPTPTEAMTEPMTSAAESGASIFKMMDQSRHRSMDTLRGYVRSADLSREHAGSAFL
jgi:hypothetical protein